VAAAALVPAAAIPTAGPSMKWAQDSKKIYLTIGMDCKTNVKFTPTEDTFALSCNDSKGKVQSIAFLLREDILEKESICKSTRGEEVCTLVKKFDHFWDRLPHNENDIKTLKQDWNKWKNAEEDQSPSDDYYSSPNEKKWVKTVSPDEYSLIVKNSATVFVDASLGWCTKCAFTRKAFTSAARQLGGSKTAYGKTKPVSFVYVNTLQHRQAARSFNVSCDYPCKFYVVREEAPTTHEEIEVKGQETDIVQTLEGRMSPLLTKVNSEEDVENFSKMHAVTALVMLKAIDSPEYKAALHAATTLRGKVAVMWADEAIGGISPPAVRLWVNSSAPRSVEMSDQGAVLARSMVAMSWGFDMFNYTWAKRELFDLVALPVAHVFLDEEATTAATLKMFQDAAKEFRGELAFVRFNKNNNFMLKDFGLADDKVPSFGIADTFAPTGKRYGMDNSWLSPATPESIPDPASVKPTDWSDEEDGDWESPLVRNPEYRGEMRATRFSKDKVISFTQDYLNGKLTPNYKSEHEPLDTPPGALRTVVYKNSMKQGALDSEESVLLLFYKPWATSKDKVVATLQKVAEALTNMPEMRLARMDTSKNHIDTDRFSGVDDYSNEPALFLCTEGRVVPYKGALAQSDLLKFLAKNVKKVKAGWEEKVKPKLKEIKDRITEHKNKLAAIEETRKDDALVEKNRLDELVKDVKKIDVSPAKDGGIIKQILKPGDGVYRNPKSGDKVTAHYSGTLEDGSKFDSSVDRGQPFEFEIGKGAVIPCWDVAMMTMLKGEKALLTCTSEHGYRERGAGDRIPPHATLRFEVELISWGPAEEKKAAGSGGGNMKIEL